METIYLTGYHGVGKTIIGKLLASRKDLKYLDTELDIEEQEKSSTEEIKNKKGLDQYNSLEKYILKYKINQGMIVSLSSEIPKDEENRHLIKTSGRVIYLRAKPDTIFSNINNDLTKKSRLNSNLSVLTIEKELNELKPYYEELTNYAIDIDNKKLSDVFKEALAIYNYVNKVKCHIFIK